jgi:hypothetical protein
VATVAHRALTFPRPGARAQRLARVWTPWVARRAAIIVAVPVAIVAVGEAVTAPWGSQWNGWDFRVYLTAASRLISEGSPYRCDLGAPCFLYSPAFAVLTAPLTLIPEPIAIALWRLGALAALAWSMRGTGPLGLLVFCIPGLWTSDLLVGNVSAYATAAMIAVVRWPSVRTVVGYAVLVAVIPKPQFLPVLAYGLWHVREARLPVLLIGFGGIAMLGFPGYLGSLIHQGGAIGMGNFALPEPWAKIAAIVLTIAALRWPRLLGLAAVCAALFWWDYATVPLALLVIKPGRAPTPRPGSSTRRRVGVDRAL